MSAVRDQKQGFTFVYTNIYELYKKSSTKAVPDPVDVASKVSAKPYEPPRFDKPEASKVAFETPAVRDLKQNLDKLQTLHSRLTFMLKELEELVKKNS